MVLLESFPYTPGDLFDDRYYIDAIRRGNMGIVMLCQDTKTEKPVAIKTIDRQFLYSEIGLQTFLDEASTWIQLERHPNIVQAYSLEMIEDRPYLFLERVIADNMRGTTLKDLMFTKPLSSARMIQIAIHICDGMIHALYKFPELVHRDLKTENILVGIEGLPKVSDFGMTHRVDDFEDDWESQIYSSKYRFNPSLLASKLKGTPSFASPEQCRNEPLDTRSDIYACGCTFYHIATKHTPFVKPSVEEYIIAQIYETPKHPNDYSANILPEFSSIVMTCLAKKPDERYQTFNDLRQDLIEIYENSFGEEPHSFLIGPPLTVDEYIERSHSFLVLQQYHHARAELLKAIQLDSTRCDIYYHLGRISYERNKIDQALHEFKQARAAMVDNPDLDEMIGNAYQRLGMCFEASSYYRKAIRFDPTRESLYHRLVDIQLEQNDFNEAIKTVNQALESCGEEAELLILLAKCYHQIGDLNREYGTLEKVTRVDPDRMEIFLLLAQISLEKKNHRNAFRWARKILDRNPNSFQLCYETGLIFKALDDLKLTVEIWRRAAVVGEGTEYFYQELATLYLQLGSYEDAWSFASRAEALGANVDDLIRDIQKKRFRM